MVAKDRGRVKVRTKEDLLKTSIIMVMAVLCLHQFQSKVVALKEFVININIRFRSRVRINYTMDSIRLRTAVVTISLSSVSITHMALLHIIMHMPMDILNLTRTTVFTSSTLHHMPCRWNILPINILHICHHMLHMVIITMCNTWPMVLLLTINMVHHHLTISSVVTHIIP